MLVQRFHNPSIVKAFGATREAKDIDDAWSAVAANMNNTHTGEQCKVRLRTILQKYGKYTNELKGNGETGNNPIKVQGYFDLLGECLQNEFGLAQACNVDSTGKLRNQVDLSIEQEETLEGRVNPFDPQTKRVAWNAPTKKSNGISRMTECMEKLVSHITRQEPAEETTRILELKGQIDAIQEQLR
ncbi:hypothetical protein AeMF1_008228, partial [Aphanomyces euteiches]